jgi:hypothetical protein
MKKNDVAEQERQQLRNKVHDHNLEHDQNITRIGANSLLGHSPPAPSFLHTHTLSLSHTRTLAQIMALMQMQGSRADASLLKQLKDEVAQQQSEMAMMRNEQTTLEKKLEEASCEHKFGCGCEGMIKPHSSLGFLLQSTSQEHHSKFSFPSF